MAINLLEISKDYLTDGVIKLIGNKVGIGGDEITDVVGKVFPSLLGLFGEKAESAEGAESLFNLVNDSDDGILDNLTDLFSGDTEKLAEGGLSSLTSLFGDNVSSITDKLGSLAGLGGGKTSGLLGLLTPVLMGILKKQVLGGSLGATGLQSLLKSQAGPLAGVFGDGFMNKLGLAGLGTGAAGLAAGAKSKVTETVTSGKEVVTSTVETTKEKVSGAAYSTKQAACDMKDKAAAATTSTTTSTTRTYEDNSSGGGGGFFKWLLPLLLIPLLLWLLFTKGCFGGAADALKDGANAVGDGAKAVGEGAVDGVKKVGEGAVDGAKAVGEGAKKVGEGAVDGVKKVGEGAVDGAKAIGEGAKKVGAGAVDGVKKVGEGAVDGAKAVGEGAKKVGEGAVDGAKKVGAAVTEPLSTKPVKVEPAATPGDVEPADEAKKKGPKKNKGPKLSKKAKGLINKLKNVNPEDEKALDGIYADLAKDGSSGFLYRIPFATGETGVPGPHQEALIAKLKSANPGATLVTIGYADTRGDDEQNKQLSYGRAKEVGEWITKTLGSGTKLESASMGETDRFSKSDFAKNRVVEVWQVME